LFRREDGALLSLSAGRLQAFSGFPQALEDLAAGLSGVVHNGMTVAMVAMGGKCQLPNGLRML